MEEVELVLADIVFNKKNPVLFFYNKDCYHTTASEAMEIIQARELKKIKISIYATKINK